MRIFVISLKEGQKQPTLNVAIVYFITLLYWKICNVHLSSLWKYLCPPHMSRRVVAVCSASSSQNSVTGTLLLNASGSTEKLPASLFVILLQVFVSSTDWKLLWSYQWVDLNEDDHETSLVSASDCGIGFLKTSPHIVNKYLDFKHSMFSQWDKGNTAQHKST